MTDERNDASGRDGVDRAQNPPPLIPPPVRRNDSGEQPYSDANAGSGAPVDPVFSDRERTDDALNDGDGERASTDPRVEDTPARDDTTSGDRPADPAYEERPVDGDQGDGGPYAGQSTPTPADSDDSARADADRRELGQRDDAAAESRYAPVAAREASDDRQAVRDTAADAEPVTVANPSTAPDAAPSPVFVPSAQGGYEQTAAYPPAPVVQREFVEPPVEPKKRGNRGVGSLIAFLSVILFAIIYSAIAAAIIVVQQPQDLGEIFLDFVQSPAFYIPAIIFVVAFIIVVLLANRASWWAYVLGSLFVGALVYFGSIGVALLLANPASLTPDDARQLIEQRALNPFLITAALVAREVSLWTGSAIASRGRRMKSRNLTAREEYERASADHRAEYERSYAPSA